MTHTTILQSLETDEWFIDSSDLREFVAIAKQIISNTTGDRKQTLNTLETHFAALLKKQDWLPAEFAQPNHHSGLGDGIGQWLLYRSQDRSLTIFSLVIPPNSITPVHDHEIATLTHSQVGTPAGGWFSFQPLYDRIVREEPDLLE
jgi:3-mercaptopropionate dioxygenase